MVACGGIWRGRGRGRGRGRDCTPNNNRRTTRAYCCGVRVSMARSKQSGPVIRVYTMHAAPVHLADARPCARAPVPIRAFKHAGQLQHVHSFMDRGERWCLKTPVGDIEAEEGLHSGAEASARAHGGGA